MNYARLVHTGRLPLGFAYCALHVLAELAFTYQTIVALSAKLTKILDVICLSTFHFYWGFAPNQKSEKIISLKVGMSRHEKEGEQEDAYTETGNH